MYKVMIVDDEKAIRKLLRLMLEWEKYDMEVVAEASSGIEALNMIDEVVPDVCFVDIRMPFMDGITFAKMAIERYPKIRICMLTAYDEFEYARQCIGIGVFDYYLKPIVKEEMQSALQKLKEDLKSEVAAKEEDTKEITSIDGIKEYLLSHYEESDLNLGKVAVEFGFNANYLSRKFKKEIGNSFTEYLNELRMHRAIKLAKLGKPMYQVAEMVGIPDPNYFSKCFKKYANVTYTEFMTAEKKGEK